MANEDIKKAIKDAGIKQWIVAERLNMADYAFSKRLRHELSPAEKRQVKNAVRAIKKEERST